MDLSDLIARTVRECEDVRTRLAEMEQHRLGALQRLEAVLAELRRADGPEWESVAARDLKAGDRIQRPGYERPDQWREVSAVFPSSWLVGVFVVEFTDDGSAADLNADDRVRCVFRQVAA